MLLSVLQDGLHHLVHLCLLQEGHQACIALAVYRAIALELKAAYNYVFGLHTVLRADGMLLVFELNHLANDLRLKSEQCLH